VELTAAAGRAIDDGILVPSASEFAASPDDPARPQHTAIVARQAPARVPVAVTEPRNAVPPRNELVDCDSTAEMMVKIAKDHQNTALESIKVSLNAVLDHAKDFVEPRVGSDATSRDSGGYSPESNFLTTLKEAATEFRAEAADLMKANVIANLEYTRELAGATTLAEFVELSSAQARKQCEFILRQADALKSLAQTIVKSSAD
jgi:hypothetical protein